MKEENIKVRFIKATKWSTITQIAVKVITPVTNMILARIISPEAFGVVATVTMITSFADMFSDAGFQKYLIQHEFKDNEEKYKNANVAFWTNFFISVFLWLNIAIFRKQIANLVGNPGLGNVIAVSCVQLILTSFSSIQMALYSRDFDYKTLFLVRIIAVCIPFIVTIPLAVLGLNYWSLVIGNIIAQLSNAVILTVKSKWRPQLFYSIELLKEMLSFSIWSLIEAISIWFTLWIDVFIIGNVLNQYYLGIYKTSTSMVNALMGIITSSIVPVLFSSLSRLQNDDEEFIKLYFKTQKMVSVLVFPLGIGVYLYSDLATKIMLGNKWSEASGVIGIWALTSAIMIVFSHFCSEVYRAKGKPKLSFLAQLLHLIVLIPACIISSKYGFWPLVYTRAWIRMESVLVHFFIMKLFIKIPMSKTLRNVMPTAISAILMGILGYTLQQISSGILWSFLSIFICSVFYFVILCLFPDARKDMISLSKRILPVKIFSKIKILFAKEV